jgi:hypothetical protein
MILEVELKVERIKAILSTALVDAAVQVPADALGNEALVTWVVPNQGDGDLVCIDGEIDLDKVARALVDEFGGDR